jgi:hypothetical protein
MAADTNNQNIALQRLKRSGSFSRVHMLSFMVIFGIIGSFILYKTFAAAPLVASVEAEQMILPGGSSVVADTGRQDAGGWHAYRQRKLPVKRKLSNNKRTRRSV